MLGLLNRITSSELIARGWIVIHDRVTNERIAIRSVIQHWKSIPWSHQTYYRAKYGFDENGVLDISLSEHPISTNDPGFSFRKLAPGEVVIPDQSMPGSNNRLRTILEQSQVTAEHNRYDDVGVAFTGPDGTVLLTGEYCWGLPYLDYNDYTEIDNNHICVWGNSSTTWCPDAPWWATDPDAMNS